MTSRASFAILLTPYNQLHPEYKFPVMLALGSDKEVCLQRGAWRLPREAGEGVLPGARSPGSAGEPCPLLCPWPKL